MSAFEVDIRPPHDVLTCTRNPCGRCQPHLSTAPPIPTNPHDAEVPRANPDPVVASIGLPKHPEPTMIAKALREAADAIDDHAMRAIGMARNLAAKGYSASTLGDGGSRGTDTTSSTERHALHDGSHRWDKADRAYALALQGSWRNALHVRSMTDELLRHASDADPLPAGTGECKACARFCRPDKGQGDRLRSGLCQTCYRAWNRYDGDMLWSAWVAQRREGYTERDAAGNVVAIHSPEPDHGGDDDA